MQWDVLAADAEKVALAQALVPVSAKRGWGASTLRLAAAPIFDDSEAWRRHFPRGARDAIWFISEVSDSSMRAAFECHPAADIADVIRERLEQNSDLKAFVFRVMLFDVTHPFQAVARMQRTALAMRQCLAAGAKTPGATVLNWTYTCIVFVWLCDRTRGDALTMHLNQWLMRRIGG
jgi:hypothetical protein